MSCLCSALLHYLCRVTFLQCDIGFSAVTDFPLLENLVNLKRRPEEQHLN